MSDNAPTPITDLHLSCPYCGGSLSVNMREEGSGYSSYDVPDSMECMGENWCNAEWETTGTLRSRPLFVQYPELYNRPEGYFPVQK